MKKKRTRRLISDKETAKLNQQKLRVQIFESFIVEELMQHPKEAAKISKPMSRMLKGYKVERTKLADLTIPILKRIGYFTKAKIT